MKEYVDTCTPEERLARGIAATKEWDEDYRFVPDMTWDDDKDNATLKYLGVKPEDLPIAEDRNSYEAYLKANP